MPSKEEEDRDRATALSAGQHTGPCDWCGLESTVKTWTPGRGLGSLLCEDQRACKARPMWWPDFRA